MKLLDINNTYLEIIHYKKDQMDRYHHIMAIIKVYHTALNLK